MDKKKILMIVWICLLAFLVVLFINKTSDIKTKKEETKIKTVANYSRFFTISGCANKYINYLSSKDKDSLYKLLSKSYIKKHNITKDNILNTLDDFDGKIYTFEAKKIYSKEINDNEIRYYVYGYLNEQLLDTYVEPKDYYLIINLDTKNSLFSVTPYNGNIFKEASK